MSSEDALSDIVTGAFLAGNIQENMMANRTRSTNQPKKTACEERGHLWMSTTASNFRYCDRSDCKRTERLDDNGTWVLVEKVTKQKQVSAPQAEPLLTVWDACDHIGVACHGDTLPRTSLKNFWTDGVEQEGQK